MNVLIIGEYFPPDIGGAATRASNIAKGLTLNNCDVTLVTAFPHYPTGKVPDEFKYRPIKIDYIGKMRIIRTFVVPLESKGLSNRLIIFWSFMVSSILACPFVGKFDIVWAANPDVFVLVPANFYGFIKRKKIVTNVDDLIIEDLYDLDLIKKGSAISKVAEFLARVLFANIAAATPISPGYTPTIIKYGIHPKKIQVVRGGVDLDVFKPRPVISSDEKFVVMYSGGLSIAYDFDQILQAAKIVEDEDKNVTFVIQGKGEQLNSIRLKVKEFKVKNVQVIDKLFSRPAVSQFLRQANVLILPLAKFKTPYRGMSSKLYEYQAVGKPIICCSNGMPSDYVVETNSGLVVKPGDYTELARAILTLRRNPELCEKLGKNGLLAVTNEASIGAIGKKMKAILKLATS